MSIADARAGFVDVLGDITGLHVYAVWPSTLQTPAVVPVLSDWSYGVTFDGGMDATFLLAVVTQIGSVEKAQTDMDAYLEISNSIAAAIRADPTLGGKVMVADVVGGTRYTTDEIDGISRVVPSIQVEVKW